MRKKILLVSILSQLLVTDIMAQGLTQSADGSSTIPVNGTVLSIDIAKTDLSFGYTNLNQKINTGNFRLLWGANVKVKNEEGFGALFSKGDIVGSGGANVFFGANYEWPNSLLDYSDKLDARHAREVVQVRADIKANLVIFITTIRDTAIRHDLLRQLAVETMPESFDGHIIVPAAANNATKQVYERIKKISTGEGKAYSRLVERQTEEMAKVDEDFRSSTFQRISLFGFGGISAIDFKHFKGIDSTKLSNSLEDKNERGGNIGLGLNYQRGNFWFGITYAYLETNNYELLKKAEYTLRTTTTINNQVLIEEKKITGYKGNFGRVSMNSVDVDFIYRVNLDKEKETKNFLLINPYLRSTLATRDKDILPNSANIGAGFYFWSKKFLGGFYIELPDVENNFEKMKPVEDQQLRSPWKRMTFGIVTKYNFSTIKMW